MTVYHHRIMRTTVDIPEHLLDRVYEVYYRVMARLAHAAERLEEAVGLEPLPLPGAQEA